MTEILGANSGPFLIAEAVFREALYIHVTVDGVREKEPVSLESLFAAGVLAVVEPESDEEFQTLIDLSLELDDGEAMTCVLAQHRGYRIATDERKTIRLIENRITAVGTLDLIRGWAENAPEPLALVQEVLVAIENRGYVPGTTHVHYAWWKQFIGGDE